MPTLFSQFREAIRSGSKPDSPSLRLATSGSLAVYYAPFEYVNSQARLVLVGITPGRTQAQNALSEARRLVSSGASDSEAVRGAKQVGAFSGALRSNLTAMLDHIGLHEWLGVQKAEHLFGSSSHLLQTASVLQFPVFLGGENYNGTPDPVATPLLRGQIVEHFAPLGAALPRSVFLPLGPVATKVMEWLTQQGRFDSAQVLAGLPHPSGANAERIQYFLGRKAAAHLSVKTNAALIDGARDALRAKVARLANR